VQPEPTPLARILEERIRRHGPITFAQYMEACLYHSEHGYYTKALQQLRRDYFTSVDAGPIFGRLLARQFQQMWTELGKPTPFALVEVGAGNGALAKYVLDSAAAAWPEFDSAAAYLAVERSAQRRSAQAELLESHINLGRFSCSATLPDEIACGCLFSNELLDAMPVHRVIARGSLLHEIYVTLGRDGFAEEAGPLSRPALANYFSEQGITLQDEQQAEVCLEARSWIEDVGRRLARGFVLTIDYGCEAGQLYDGRHMRGTMLAYSQHRASEDYFRAPGEQDLTAHVNLTALDLWGRRGGLVRSGFAPQTNFLLALARAGNFEDVEMPEMSEAQRTRARLLFKTLIHPEGMGETFQVTVQHKGIESPQLLGFEPL
jgi:SAM-dependent MidA family methyltransferase